MNEKSIRTLEYHKVVAALAAHTSFSASHDLAEALRPHGNQADVERAQGETTEARTVLELRPEITTAGARDVRPAVARADLGGIVEPADLLLIAATLSAARGMKRIIIKLRDTGAGLPLLGVMALRLEDLPDLRAAYAPP